MMSEVYTGLKHNHTKSQNKSLVQPSATEVPPPFGVVLNIKLGNTRLWMKKVLPYGCTVIHLLSIFYCR